MPLGLFEAQSRHGVCYPSPDVPIEQRVNSVPDLGPFCFRNSTEDPVNGLHVIFTGHSWDSGARGHNRRSTWPHHRC
jgi:hypothetical protein